ncbi:MAG: LptF/LptG family permease [Chitinophagales bacterium]
MKIIDKLILRTFAGPFFLTFFITLFIIVMQFLWKYIDDLVGKGLEWYIVFELIFYASASFVPLALPLAVLLSSIMTFGSLGENYELVALKSSGISLFRFMRVLIFTVVGLSFVAFFFSNNILPIANLKFGALLYDIRQQKPALNIKEGVFYNDLENFSIKVGRKEEDNRSIHDIIVYDQTSKKGNDNILLAESGEMFTSVDERYLILRLYNGHRYQEMIDGKKESTHEHLRTSFDTWEKKFDLSEFALDRSEESFWKNHYQMMNLKQLQSSIDTLYMDVAKRRETLSRNFSNFFLFKKAEFDTLHANANIAFDTIPEKYAALFNNSKADVTEKHARRALSMARNVKSYIGVSVRDLKHKRKYIAKHNVEWHRKFTLSVACLVLFFIGAPLGAIIRMGGLGMPLLISIIFFVIFHVFSMSGEKIAENGGMSPFAGMWLSTFVLLPIGIFLTYKAMKDSPLFDVGWYYSNIKRILPKRFNSE